MKGSGAKLSIEDRILWNRVARTTVPLRGKEAPFLPDDDNESEPEQVNLKLENSGAQVPRPSGDHKDTRRLQPLDRPTKTKLAKERLSIDARVDLHGLTQAEAHTLLLSFLHRAFTQGLRHVLVITGKGSSRGSEGVLQRAVPVWLATAPFRPLVGGYDHAARRHGGSGALYVRLRRPTGG